MFMEYKGRYPIFDPSGVCTYPVVQRRNKVTLEDLICPEAIRAQDYSVCESVLGAIQNVAEAVQNARAGNKPVMALVGAHAIKNGLGPILIDLVGRGVITLIAGNGATAIHDFELALIGQTSEDVPKALQEGQFGMAREFSYINTALLVGDQHQLGYGESLGRMICDESFCREVSGKIENGKKTIRFQHPQASLLAACYRENIPCTVHAGIGTDVIDQHASFDGRAKGGCSGRDFLIFVEQVAQLRQGGVVLNIGSAVTGPEVLLKAVSMAANVGRAPAGLVTADFDLRPHDPEQMTDEQTPGYYFRDQKSIVTRIPKAFDGRGYYLCGDQKQTLPLLYRYILGSGKENAEKPWNPNRSNPS
ncbi:MAG: hypothetical protein JW828_10240 [Sedimentisphaerales bacterium]|nr:hypothetical protein [Sedimentisphaerales bacterium]